MPARSRSGMWSMCLLLVLCLWPLVGASHPPAPGDDTIKARLKACLVSGDMACVVDQYLVLKDIGRMPGWLVAFQNAFAVANRKAGECERVARTVHEGLVKLGQRPEFIRFSVRGESGLLSFSEASKTGAPKAYQVAVTGNHLAVKLEGKIIDAYTGLAGLPFDEYMKRLGTSGVSQVLYEVVKEP